jgi:hypothetical protein
VSYTFLSPTKKAYTKQHNSLIICYISFLCFLPHFFPCYQMIRLGQVVNCKAFLLYSTLHFTHPYQHVITSHWDLLRMLVRAKRWCSTISSYGNLTCVCVMINKWTTESSTGCEQHVPCNAMQKSVQLRPKVVQIVRTIAQAVSRRVRTRVRSCGICGGRSGTGAGFLRVLRFPMPIFIPPIAPESPSSTIWGWYNRPVVAAVPSGLSLTPLRILKKVIKR